MPLVLDDPAIDGKEAVMPLCHLAHADLFHDERGEGEPLVFLNGLSGDHLYWRSQFRAFGKKYRCLAVDNRDVGQSSYAAGPYTMRDLAGDLIEWMEQLQLPPAHVVGLSMGGAIAQELALAAPKRVKTLVLMNTLARADDWFRGTLRAFEVIRRQVADTAAFFDTILPWWVSHRFFEDSERASWLRVLLRQSPHPQRLDGFLRQLEALSTHDAAARLHQFACPVLVMAGEDDSVAPVRYSRQLQELIPQARLIVLRGVGHAPPLEDAGQFNARLMEFLEMQTL
ncbi:MAG TPA: alpha/beta hydrolase [Gemmataceae bacterium]|nr:alpha/beta hydrolase [Gemmataceae bacterium]